MATRPHSTITRRQALTGTAAGAAAIVAGSVPAIAGAHPDAELLELGRQYDAIYTQIVETHHRVEAIDPDRPIEPEALKVRPGDRDLGIDVPRSWNGDQYDTYSWQTVDELRGKPRVRPYRGPIRLNGGEYRSGWEIMDEVVSYTSARDEPWPEAQARADEIVAAWDAYRAESNVGCEAIAALEAEIDRLQDDLSPIADAIVDFRAETLDGLMVKAKAVRWIYWPDPEELEVGDGATDDALMRSIAGDLIAMMGARA